MSNTAWFKVYNRGKNSKMGSMVGDKPILATDADHACKKMKAKHPHLRLSRLFARPVSQEVAEADAKKAAQPKVEVEIEVPTDG